MRGTLETIVGAMFAGKTSELLKRILWAEHQGKKILVIKSKLDNRYSEELISTHNNNNHNQCTAMSDIFSSVQLKLDQGTLGMSDPSQVNLHQGHQGHQAIRTTRATRATRVIRATKNNEKLIKTMENDEKQ